MMDGHRPALWLSDRYAAQQGHGVAHQTCLAHLARDIAYAVEASDDPVPWRLQIWLNAVFALAGRVTSLAASTLSAKRRALERQLAGILATASSCDLTRTLQGKITNGYRAMWAAKGEAAVRTVVDTARLTTRTTVFGTILRTVGA